MKWVKVSERLPKKHRGVNVAYKNIYGEMNVGSAVIIGGRWFWWEGDLADCDIPVGVEITHWKYLPPLPKEA